MDDVRRIGDKMLRAMNELEGKAPHVPVLVELTAVEAGIVLTALTLVTAVRAVVK